MFGVLHGGLARWHRANPVACLRVESLYATPVLLSGLASLVLSNKQENLLDHYYKVHIERLLKLHQATPAPVVFLLAGCLPFKAIHHLRMVTLFSQLCRLRDGDNVLARKASCFFSSAQTCSKSWFRKLRSLFLFYGLPHPSKWVTSPPTKSYMKRLVKPAVISYYCKPST